MATLAGKLGESPTWCAAKWVLRARVAVRSTRSKSADRNRRSITARGRQSRCVPERLEDSDRQTLAALGAAGVDDSTATAGLHANEEAVRTSAADFRSLVGTFHDRSGPRGLLMRCCRAVVDAVAFVRLFVHYRVRCSCLVFGKPTITPNSPAGVNELGQQVVSTRSRPAGHKLWITGHFRPAGTYNPAAPTRTFPQHER